MEGGQQGGLGHGDGFNAVQDLTDLKAKQITLGFDLEIALCVCAAHAVYAGFAALGGVSGQFVDYV